MSVTTDSSDAAILRTVGERLERVRLERNLTRRSLADQAGVSPKTVERLEGGEPVNTVSLIRVMRSLGMAGNFEGLVPPPLPSPIARLAGSRRQRQRASG